MATAGAGPEVVFANVTDQESETAALEQKLRSLKEQEIPPEHITIVSVRGDWDSSAGKDLRDARRGRVARNLERVRAVVDAEAGFQPFRSTPQALVSAKALLLVLLRPDLEELLAWPEEDTGADHSTRITAALLAGRLRGLARESTSMRSVAFDDLTAAWAVRLVTM